MGEDKTLDQMLRDEMRPMINDRFTKRMIALASYSIFFYSLIANEMFQARIYILGTSIYE